MIAALAGRRIDEENASYERFPLRCVASVRQLLQNAFSKNRITHLVSSAACGADLLGQLVAHEMKIQRTIVIPFSAEKFKIISVTDRPGDWGDLYDRLIKGTNVIQLEYGLNDDDAYQKTNLEIIKECNRLHTQQDLKEEIAAIVVWDKNIKSSGDITHAFKVEAESRNLKLIEISTLTK